VWAHHTHDWSHEVGCCAAGGFLGCIVSTDGECTLASSLPYQSPQPWRGYRRSRSLNPALVPSGVDLKGRELPRKRSAQGFILPMVERGLLDIGSKLAVAASPISLKLRLSPSLRRSFTTGQESYHQLPVTSQKRATLQSPIADPSFS